MSWADRYIAELKAGRTVSFRPRGDSMSGRIESGQLVTVEPADKFVLSEGLVVLCMVKGSQYLHLIRAFDDKRCRVQIANNRGHINGWTAYRNIYGVVTRIEA